MRLSISTRGCVERQKSTFSPFSFFFFLSSSFSSSPSILSFLFLLHLFSFLFSFFIFFISSSPFHHYPSPPFASPPSTQGMPYFHVDFGSNAGFAHVIEDERLFKRNFGLEILGGMMDLDPFLWRKPPKEDFNDQMKKCVEFAQKWRPFDWTEK